MKKIIPVLLLIIFYYSGVGQFKTKLIPHSTDPEIRQLIAEGTKYLYGAGGYEQNYFLAFDILSSAAKEGEPIAHLLIAKMYEQGVGVKVHPQKAYKHYKLAAEGGEKAGMLELGITYKNGKGVNLDFKKASKYFKQGSDKNSPRAHYALGYMHFKGFGVKQDYLKAVTLFEKSSLKEYPAGQFMLGVCYEEGFGKEIDLNKAKYYYELAAEQNYKQAKSRLNGLTNQSPTKSTRIIDEFHEEFLKNDLIPVHFIKVQNTDETDLQIEGYWEGELLIYDWSGKDIKTKEKVTVNLNQNNFSINAEWNSNLTHNTSTGIVLGNEIHFDNLNLVTEDAFGNYTLKNVSNISLSKEYRDNMTFLSGNIETYLPDKKEPGPPTFIVLKGMTNVSKAGGKISALKSDKNIYEKIEPEFNIYPNPFESNITIQYQVFKPGIISINLYNSAGRKIKEIKSEELCVVGQFTINSEIDSNPGTYIVEIVQDGQRQTRNFFKY